MLDNSIYACTLKRLTEPLNKILLR